MECWGGATFDSCLRFLNEDPWERLRKIRDKAKNTKLQMLLRGQNLLGYKHYADDVVEYFVQKSIANGIDIIRIFDALNDPRNVEVAIKATKKEGGHTQGAVCYTISPFHDLEQFVKDAKGLVEAGADSICIKDMAGLLTPYTAYELVKALKENIKVPIQLHTHYTSGVASMTYLKAIEAGCDVVDCAISPMAMGTSQPPTESMVATLQGTEYDTGYDLKLLSEIADYFRPLREEYLSSGLLNTKLSVLISTHCCTRFPEVCFQTSFHSLSSLARRTNSRKFLKKCRVREDLRLSAPRYTYKPDCGNTGGYECHFRERYKMIRRKQRRLSRANTGKHLLRSRTRLLRKSSVMKKELHAVLQTC